MLYHIKTLIIDGDNTLWDCAVYYIDRQNKFAEACESATGIGKDICLNILKNIDAESIKLPGGFSRVRFPRSFAAASMALDILVEREPDFDRAADMWHLGDSVFNAEYPMYPGAAETLKKYQDADYRLILYTKGDLDVQKNKIEKNNLRQFFPEDHTFITLTKDVVILQSLLATMKVDKHRAAVVGDSIKDEIHPAKELQMTSVHVSGKANTNWAYEDKKTEADFEIPTFAQLPTIIPA